MERSLTSIEFFQENDWTVNFGEGIITKVIRHSKRGETCNTSHNEGDVESKISHRIQIGEARQVFMMKITPRGLRIRFRVDMGLKPDAPKRARNLYAEYRKIQINGPKSYDRLMHGGRLFGFSWLSKDSVGEVGEAVWKGRDFKGKEVEFTVDNVHPLWSGKDKLIEMYTPSLANVQEVNVTDPKTGEDTKALRVALQGGGEFPHLNRFHLNSNVHGQAGLTGEETKIESWIKYLNTPVPGVKKSGPALDYYRQNPGVLEVMDTKPVVITRDPIDVARQSDFPEDWNRVLPWRGGHV